LENLQLVNSPEKSLIHLTWQANKIEEFFQIKNQPKKQTHKLQEVEEMLHLMSLKTQQLVPQGL
jgi:hypothetical protein